MNMRRPIGITLLAAWQFLSSGFGLFISLTYLFSLFALNASKRALLNSHTLAKHNPALHNPHSADQLTTIAPQLQAGLGILGILMAALGLLLGYGLWKLQPWALLWAKIQSIWNLCTKGLALFSLAIIQKLLSAQSSAAPPVAMPKIPSYFYGQVALQLLFGLLIIIYLFSPEIRQAFTYRRTESYQRR